MFNWGSLRPSAAREAREPIHRLLHSRQRRENLSDRRGGGGLLHCDEERGKHLRGGNSVCQQAQPRHGRRSVRAGASPGPRFAEKHGPRLQRVFGRLGKLSPRAAGAQGRSRVPALGRAPPAFGGAAETVPRLRDAALMHQPNCSQDKAAIRLTGHRILQKTSVCTRKNEHSIFSQINNVTILREIKNQIRKSFTR